MPRRAIHICSLMLFCLFLAAPGRATEEITLVYAAALAEVQPNQERGGLPQLASLLKTLRREKKPVLFLHGGGALSPSILSATDRGAHMISLLNLLQPDALALAKSEFAHKEDELSQRAMEATFPLLVANLRDPLNDEGGIAGTTPWQLLTVGSYRIGLLALVDPEVIVDYLPTRAQPIASDAAIATACQALRAAGADLIVLLADFRPPGLADMLAARRIDLALINDPALDPPAEQPQGNYYEYNSNRGGVCLFTLTLSGSRPNLVFSGQSRTLSLTDFPADHEMQGKIDGYLAQLADILTVPLAVTRTPLDTRRTALRGGENAFANLLADILREFYDADCALINGGGIRGNRLYPAGTTLTRGDIHREIPFNNRVVNIEVSGRQLWESMENGLSRIEDGKGRFPQVSGLKVSYNRDRPPGKRVIAITVGEEKLQPEKIYSLATLDYLAEGGDGYLALKNSKRLTRIGGGRLFWEYVRNGLSQRGEIAPTIEGRLTSIKDEENDAP